MSVALNLSPGCVTGVGSLPHTDPDLAIEFVAERAKLLSGRNFRRGTAPGKGAIGQGMGRLIELLEPAGRPYCWAVHRSSRASELENGLEKAEAGLLPGSAAGFYSLKRTSRRIGFPMRGP